MDWVGVFLSLLGWFLMAKHRHMAMVVLLAANLVWVIWAVPLHVWSLVTLQVCFMVLNIRTILEWSKIPTSV